VRALLKHLSFFLCLWHYFLIPFILCDDEKMEDNVGEHASTLPVAIWPNGSVRKITRPPFGRALLIVYKKVLSMIHHAFKMVAHLEKIGTSQFAWGNNCQGNDWKYKGVAHWSDGQKLSTCQGPFSAQALEKTRASVSKFGLTCW